ncbi:hypothetical protein ACGFH8_28670 [Micromonospora sp. NPDC049175]|uniref:hypothetical protein n=1 Tax=Micromonospora sp. NPDC049175 TaxID=3364266 RepID=UPI003716276B
MLTTELDQLVSHLRRLERSVVSLLRPGLTDPRTLSLSWVEELPETVIEWFRWCNGVEERPGQLQDDVNVIPGYNPLSIEEAGRLVPSYAGDPVLGEHFLPLLTTAGGDIYAAAWNPGEDGVRVAGVLVGEPTELEFSSIHQMVSLFNACYESGAFFVDRDGRLALDPGKYDETYAEVVVGE